MSNFTSSLLALCPLDGRYGDKTTALQEIFSEYGLIKSRVTVEIAWFLSLCQNDKVVELPPLNDEQIDAIGQIIDGFSVEDAAAVKEIESTTNHDVKAVEYFLKERFLEIGVSEEASEFIHFALTSEDVNNTAYAIMLHQGRDYLLASFEDILDNLADKARDWSDVPMLSRTHGQTASPTTVGKEIANVHYRLNRQLNLLDEQEILGKINGAVGNYNAHSIAYPEIDWPQFAADFIEQLGLTHNPMTTQIEPHDYVAEIMANIMRINTIAIDFCRDVWSYISLGYFSQKTVAGEVGSSTMPHKVNPIDFENAEGNFGLSSALADHMAMKLPISRLQRDLTDSTVQRNLGLVFGYSHLASLSLLKGLNKLNLNPARLNADLEASWEVLAEAIQTVMRRHGIEKPYEKLKALTRGRVGITKQDLIDFVYELDIPQDDKSRLLELTPQSYTGLAEELVGAAMNDEF